LKNVFVRHDIEGLLTLGTSFQAFQIIFESIRLGLFDILNMHAVSDKKIAEKTGMSAGALTRLLRSLSEMGLLQRQQHIYKNTSFTQQYLCKNSRHYIGDFFIHRETLMEPWAGLKFSLTHNKMVAPRKNRIADYPRQLKKFMSAMDSLGRIKSSYIQQTFNFSQYTQMLDLGGGIGTYAVSIVRRNPMLHATVFDLENVIRYTRFYIQRNKLQKRITLAAGQCLEDPLPEGPFDLVFISNLLHIYTVRDCKKILKKASGVLKKNGTLVVHDYIFGCGDSVAVSLFDMTMLVGTPHGRCYEKKDIISWLKSSGIAKIKSAEILGGTSILWGNKA
jgi:3-hydroxy-5-methyl-1-naphthoate 3-O-methyltransferase